MSIIIFAAILTGLILSPLGCLVLWKRYVYFGDGLSHSALFVGVLSITSGIPILYAAVINAVIFITAIMSLKDNSGNNAAIAMISSIMISLSLILSHFFPEKVNINNMLFGDILSVDMEDIYILLILLALVASYLFITYRNLVLISLSSDIASSRSVKVRLIEISFLAILSFAVLITIKIVGAFLVTSVLLIPAMIGRLIAKSPIMMVVFAILSALIMNMMGVVISFYFDIPFAPVIILSGAAIYFLTLIGFRRNA